MKTQEHVGVVGKSIINKMFPPQLSLQFPTIKHFTQNLNKRITFMRRPAAEVSEMFRQIIPYIIIIRDKHVFTYTRTKNGSEKRLHNAVSLGVGGHINPVDNGKHSLIMSCIKRELNEELTIIQTETIPLRFKIIGVINHDEDEVGKVHTGLVFLLKLHPTAIITVNKETVTGRFLTIDKILNKKEDLELWSKIVFDDFLNLETQKPRIN